MFAAKVYVDIEIAALAEAHGIAEQVYDALEQEIPEVKYSACESQGGVYEKNNYNAHSFIMFCIISLQFG